MFRQEFCRPAEATGLTHDVAFAPAVFCETLPRHSEVGFRTRRSFMFTHKKGLITLLMVLIPVALTAGQLFGNPTLRVPVSHAPGLGLQVQKVVFAEGIGEGATEFTEQLMARFVGQNVQVLERGEMNALLREQDFSLSGAVDRTTATALGKILGPTVMIFVNMQRYTTDQTRVFNDWKDYKGVVHRTYISRTKAYVRTSIRSVDLATGRIFAAKVLEANPVQKTRLTIEGGRSTRCVRGSGFGIARRRDPSSDVVPALGICARGHVLR
jgi:hypothetical protein